MTEAQKRAKERYDRENSKGVYLKLNIKTDGDILERLDAVPEEMGGKQGYIKALIRKDMADGHPLF